MHATLGKPTLRVQEHEELYRVWFVSVLMVSLFVLARLASRPSYRLVLESLTLAALYRLKLA